MYKILHQVFTNEGMTLICKGTPVDSIWSDGMRSTKFEITVKNDGSFNYNISRGSRTPLFNDVADVFSDIIFPNYQASRKRVSVKSGMSGEWYRCGDTIIKSNPVWSGWGDGDIAELKAIAEFCYDTWNDKQAAIACCRSNRDGIQVVNPEFRHDREIAMAAVRANGENLSYLPDFQADYKVCLAAVKNNGKAIWDVAGALREAPELIFTAAKTYPSAVTFLPNYLLSEAVIRKCVEANPDTIKTIIRDGNSVGCSFYDADREPASPFAHNKELALLVVSKKGDLLKYFGSEIMGDEEVILAAVKSCPEVIGILNPLILNERIIKAAVQEDAKAAKRLPLYFSEEKRKMVDNILRELNVPEEYYPAL